MPSALLFLVLLGIVVVVVTPVLVVVALVKYSGLKVDFEALLEKNRKQASEYRSEISEIRQLTARLRKLEIASEAQRAEGGAVATDPQPVVAPVVSAPSEVAAKPIVVRADELATSAEVAVSPSSEDEKSIPSVHANAAAPSLAAPPPKPTAPTPTTKVPLREPDTPTTRLGPPEIAQPAPSTPPRSPSEPKSPPPLIQQPSAARTTMAAATPLRYADRKPSLAQQIKKVSALEEKVGRDWLNKLGIVILVVGVAFFGIYEFSTLGAAGKAAISCLVAASLLIGGIVFEKHESYRLLGRTLIGGGWALLFFTTYGIQHVAAMRILDSLTLDCVLMLFVAVAMGAHTLRYRSQLVTGLAFLLAYTTVTLSHDTVYSLSAGVFLAVGLVAIVLKMNWFELEIFGILSSYLNHLYWLYRLLGIGGAQGHPFPEYRASLAMLVFYWLTFRISYVIRRIKDQSQENFSTAAALLNTLLLLAAMRFQSVQPELAYLALLSVGLLEFSFAQLPITKRRRTAFILLSVTGAALMIAAPPFHFSRNNVAVLWLLGAELFLIAGVLVKEVVFRRIGLLTGVLVGIHLGFVDFKSILDFRGSHDEILLSSGVLFGLSAVVLYANFLAGKTRWEESFEVRLDSWLLQTQSYIAAAAAVVGAWALTTQDWTAVAFAGVMLTLVLFARSLPILDIQAQYAAIGLLVLFRAIAVNLHPDGISGAHIVTRQVTLPILAGTFYLSAKLAPLDESPLQRALRGAFATIGSAFVALLIWYEVPGPWVAVGWTGFAVVLVLAGRRLSYSPLAWQANLLAVLAVLRTFSFNFRTGETVWSFVSLRVVTVSLVAVGLYLIARRGAPNSAVQPFIAYLHSFAATGLLACLGWYESPNGWLAPLWDGFALVLAWLDRRFQLDELAWQAHILSLLALARCVSFNLHVSTTWHGLSVRLLSLALVAVALYALSRAVRMPDEWRKRDFHHAYSWAASALVSLTLWYELVSLNITIGWAVFGLVLFEYGTLRNVAQFRYQSYVALLASFIRIFFANLTAGEPGHFWNPRTYTILPLVLIYFFVYAQSTAATASENGRSTRISGSIVPNLLAALGTASVAALFYFQFSIEWVVTSWAGLVFVLFGVAFIANRNVFLYQGLLLTLLVFFRGMAHNLFGAGYFTQGDWTGRFVVLGSAIALLFSSLVFAFPLRERQKQKADALTGWRVLSKLAARPEQLQFFVPVILLTVMLAMKMRAGMVTVSWGVEGVMVILLALTLHERSFRLTGLVLLLLCVGKVLALDVWGLQPRDRYLTFIVVGAALVFVSYLYSRYRDAIRQLL